jgi:hypothetical protein
MPDELDKKYQESSQIAAGQFRKDVSGFRQRRGLELEDLLRTERGKPEELQDRAKIQWILEALQQLQDAKDDS